jgi:hypothetical protein
MPQRAAGYSWLTKPCGSPELPPLDDGLATGATMQAAIADIRQQRPAEIVVAVPVAPPETVAFSA